MVENLKGCVAWMTPRLVAGAVGLALWALGPADLEAGPAVISTIAAGAHNGRLQVEIKGSEPLNYLLVEGADPRRVSLLFLNAVFAFPPGERELSGSVLRRVRTAVLERDGSRLGRLDLTFRESVQYRVIKAGTSVLVRVDAPAPAREFVLAGPGQDTPPKPSVAPAPRPASAVPLIRKLTPQTAGEEVRIVVEADGPLAYKSFVMENPARVVVDFERARLSRWEATIEVGNTLLRRIRLSQFDRTTVRVVLDLARPNPYWIEARTKGVVIHLGGARRP